MCVRDKIIGRRRIQRNIALVSAALAMLLILACGLMSWRLVSSSPFATPIAAPSEGVNSIRYTASGEIVVYVNSAAQKVVAISLLLVLIFLMVGMFRYCFLTRNST